MFPAGAAGRQQHRAPGGGPERGGRGGPGPGDGDGGGAAARAAVRPRPRARHGPGDADAGVSFRAYALCLYRCIAPSSARRPALKGAAALYLEVYLPPLSQRPAFKGAEALCLYRCIRPPCHADRPLKGQRPSGRPATRRFWKKVLSFGVMDTTASPSVSRDRKIGWMISVILMNVYI